MPENLDRDPRGSDTDLPDTLYHYTDINGLAGIWEKGQIWATNSMYLNDTTEVRLGMAVARAHIAQRELELQTSIADVWERQARQAEAGEEVDRESFKQERAAFEPEVAEAKEIGAALDEVSGDYSAAYIACLTEHGDQLSQWRGYAHEGYCVGLDTKMMLESLDDERVMRRVQYYDEATNEAFASRIIEIAKHHRKVVQLLDRPDLDDDFQNYVIGRFAAVEAAFMKDSNFREESEVRIVEWTTDPDLFTPHRYGMVPRRTIPIPPGAIRSVRVGPSAHEELKQRSLISYFLNVGFGGNPLPPWDERERPAVYRSSIPFRGW